LALERNYIVLWPVYFDSTKSRSEGRRLPKELCVPNPKAQEVLEAALKAGFKAILEEGKRYPKFWWSSTGRVLVEKHAPKTEVLRKVALELKKARLSTRNRRR